MEQLALLDMPANEPVFGPGLNPRLPGITLGGRQYATVTITLTDSAVVEGRVNVTIASDPPLTGAPHTPAQQLGADILIALDSYDCTKELN